MKNLLNALLASVVVLFLTSLIGCSDAGSNSIASKLDKEVLRKYAEKELRTFKTETYNITKISYEPFVQTKITRFDGIVFELQPIRIIAIGETKEYRKENYFHREVEFYIECVEDNIKKIHCEFKRGESKKTIKDEKLSIVPKKKDPSDTIFEKI